MSTNVKIRPSRAHLIFAPNKILNMEELILYILKFGIPVIALIYLIRQGVRYIIDNDLWDEPFFKFSFYFLSSIIWGVITSAFMVLLVFAGSLDSDSLFIKGSLIILGFNLLLSFLSIIFNFIIALVIFIDNIGSGIISSVPKDKILKFRFIHYEDESGQSFVDNVALLFRLFFINTVLFFLTWLFDTTLPQKVFANGLLAFPDLHGANAIEFLVIIILFIGSRLLILALVVSILNFFSKILGI